MIPISTYTTYFFFKLEKHDLNLTTYTYNSYSIYYIFIIYFITFFNYLNIHIRRRISSGN